MKKSFDAIMKNAKTRKQHPLNGWVLVTVEMAIAFLEYNVKNYRPLNGNVVRKYAADMKAGKWKGNGEAIVFSEDHILRNGQHRLHAVVKSQTPTEFYIIFDAEPGEFYDSGYKRSDYQRNLGTATPLMIAVSKIMTASTIGESVPNGINDQYIQDNLEMLKRTQQIVSNGCSKGNTPGKKAPCGAVVFSLLKSGEIPEQEMLDFFKIVNTGNLIQGSVLNASPALVLRNQLLAMMNSSGREYQKQVVECTFQAVKAYHADTIRLRKYNGSTEDGFKLIKRIQKSDEITYMNAA